MKMKKKPTLHTLEDKDISNKLDRKNEISHNPKGTVPPLVKGILRESEQLIPETTYANLAMKASCRIQAKKGKAGNEISAKEDGQNLKFSIGNSNILYYAEDHGE